MWHDVVSEVSIPNIYFYKDKLAKFLITMYDCNRHGKKLSSYLKQIFGEFTTKKMLQNVFRNWMIVLTNLRVGQAIMFFQT
jgi:hypothetical protein